MKSKANSTFKDAYFAAEEAATDEAPANDEGEPTDGDGEAVIEDGENVETPEQH
jgi:hypothetical protein